MLQLLAPAVLIGIATSGILLATPYLYAALGEMFGQISGVLNLGVEGIMLVAAFAAYYVVYSSGNLIAGLAVAIVVGALMGLLMAFISITLKAEQGISGIGVYLFGLGLSDLLFRVTIGTPTPVNGFPSLQIPFLSDLPVLGPVLFSQNILVYGAFLFVPFSWFALNKTTIGLKIRAVGQTPEAADSLGISVAGVRYLTVTFGGAMAGIAGASLSIALLNIFQQNLTSGLGFIAVALVYFGGWRPLRIMLGALLFSMVSALQLWIQTLGLGLPSDIAGMLPYVLTIIALIFAARQIVTQPTALTKPFERGE
ncbi:MAG: ABC transporter permease [Chloroflexota bacterium]|nr:MAG: ABC transporter permease [Chloroflexota bacterium]